MRLDKNEPTENLTLLIRETLHTVSTYLFPNATPKSLKLITSIKSLVLQVILGGTCDQSGGRRQNSGTRNSSFGWVETCEFIYL